MTDLYKIQSFPELFLLTTESSFLCQVLSLSDDYLYTGVNSIELKRLATYW